MAKRVLLWLALALLASGAAGAADFVVEKVIEVGPIYVGGLDKPVQWSPDGLNIAYFYDGRLFCADTMGQSRYIADIDIPPHKYEWLSEHEIVMFQRRFDSNRAVYNRLAYLDINAGILSTLRECVSSTRPSSDKRMTFEGPFKTVEGAVYFNEISGRSKEVRLIGKGGAVFTPDPFKANNEHILRTGSDALYLVEINGNDSVRISNKPYKSYMNLPMVLNKAGTHIMFGGNIVRLSDDKLIILDTLIPNPPAGFGCGIGDENFNPILPEVAFRITCDDGHKNVIRSLGIFNYDYNQLIIIDTLAELKNCCNPAYPNSGIDFTFLSEGVLYILKREAL